MTRPRLLKTEADLFIDGPKLRLRDIMDITGLSRPTLIAEMERGLLVGSRVLNRPGSAWLFTRADVAAWWCSKAQRAAS